jgi:hypothetical protein
LSNNKDYTYVDDGFYSGIDPHSGMNLAILGASGSLGLLSQTLTTDLGQTYLLSVWLDSPDGLAPNEFFINWNGITNYDQIDMPAFGWTNLQFFVTATSTNTILTLGFQDDPSYLGLDNVSVVPITKTLLKAVPKTDGIFQFVGNVLPGLNYQVQYKTNLTQSNWLNWGGNMSVTNGNLTIFDVTTNSQTFYRVLLVP